MPYSPSNTPPHNPYPIPEEAEVSSVSDPAGMFGSPSQMRPYWEYANNWRGQASNAGTIYRWTDIYDNNAIVTSTEMPPLGTQYTVELDYECRDPLPEEVDPNFNETGPPPTFWDKLKIVFEDLWLEIKAIPRVIKVDYEDYCRKKQNEKDSIDKCWFCLEIADLACDGCDKFMCLDCTAIQIEDEDFCDKCMEIKEEK